MRAGGGIFHGVGKPDSRRFYSAWIADATELDGVTMLAGYGKTVAEAILDLTFSIEGRWMRRGIAQTRWNEKLSTETVKEKEMFLIFASIVMAAVVAAMLLKYGDDGYNDWHFWAEVAGIFMGITAGISALVYAFAVWGWAQKIGRTI